jgi:hypothetical protein
MKLEKRQVIGFRADKALLKHLEWDCQFTGLRRSDVIRHILLRHYERTKKPVSIGL